MTDETALGVTNDSQVEMLFGDPWRNVYEEIQNFKILKKNKNLSATKADIEFQFFNFFFF